MAYPSALPHDSKDKDEYYTNEIGDGKDVVNWVNFIALITPIGQLITGTGTPKGPKDNEPSNPPGSKK